MFWYLSVGINPRSSTSTPAASKLRFSDNGFLPIAQINKSTVVSRPSSSTKVTLSSAFFTTFLGIAFVWRVGPSSLITFTKVSTISLSKVLKGRSRRTNKWVSTPNPLNTPASSTAIYPAPTTAIRFGNCLSANTSLEVTPYSAPSTLGIVGCPPVAISMWSAVYCSPLTSTVFLFTNLAYPLTRSTLLLFNPRS